MRGSSNKYFEKVENKRRRAVLVLDIESLFAFLFDSANCKEIVSCQP